MNNPYLAPNPGHGHGPGGMPEAGTAAPYRYGDGGAEVSEGTVDTLRQTKPWVTFMSVMMFIGAGFMVIASFAMMAFGAMLPSKGPFPGALIGAIYLPMAALYIYPALKLWMYGGAIGRLLASRSSTDLEAALVQQKSFWKFLGIVTLVSMALYFVFFIGAIIVGVVGAAASHR